MKGWLLIIIIFVIFSIISSPVLAVSKLELIARYKSEMVPVTNPMVININYTTPLPTPTPTPYMPSGFTKPSPNWPYPDFLTPFSKPSIPSSPLTKPGVTTDYVTCPPFVPVGKLHGLMVYLSCFTEPCDFINPVTGEHYRMATDDMGTKFLVKEGCQCTWA